MWTNEPIEGFSYWGNHPDFPVEDWKYEVANGDTRQGYWQWVKDNIENQKQRTSW